MDSNNKLTLLQVVKKYFNVMPDRSSVDNVIAQITEGVDFHGATLWILILAVFIASLGLNVNSTAVVIGAMLISPLMGPIVGMGLAVGIADLNLFKKAINNYLIITIFSVITATIYFTITPITDAQSELLARTSPTLYDVLIALCGGAAGILGIPNFTTWQMVYFFAVITTIATLNFLRSPIGRLTLSVREDEIAAESVGVNTTKIKIIAFVFGAVTASIAGTLQSGFIGSVVPKDYTFINSINVLIIVVFGGLGSITGAIVAAIVLGILNMLLQDVASVRMIIYALALVLVMIFRPGGLLGTWELSLLRLFKKGKKEGQN